MREDILEEIGLSKNESKVFLALLDLGSATAGKITEKSGVHRTNVYDALERLIEKGLVSYILKEKTKYFEATDPRNLLNFVKTKELKLKSILPQLMLSRQLAKSKDRAHIYEGIAGIRTTTEDILNTLSKGDKILSFGVPKDVSSRMKHFLPIYHKRRIKAKIHQRHIYNENARDRIAYLNSMSYTEAKYLPKEYNSPATTTIYKDKVAFWIWAERPLTIIIESKRMAEAYTRYFNLLWNLAKKS